MIKLLKDKVIGNIDVSRELEDAELLLLIKDAVRIYARDTYLDFEDKKELVDEIYASIRGFDILEPLIKDPSITEIMINGYKHIYIEKGGCIYESDAAFDNRDRLDDIIQNIAARSNRLVNESVPILDTTLSDGSRVNIVLDPIAIDGPAVTIRKFSNKTITMDDLIKSGSLSDVAADFLKKLVYLKGTVFVSGGTGSGKTTFLNALSEYIGPTERVISIEDSAELKLQGIGNLVRLETRNSNVEGKNAISIRDLIRSSLRMRPDRIIIGEVRGAETVDLMQALNTGHAGSLSTGHANSATDMLSRLETMFLMGMDIPLQAIKGQIAQAIDVLVHLRRYRDGKRRVEEIVEVVGLEEGQIKTNVLFSYSESTGVMEKVGSVIGKRLKKLYEEADITV
ncbi:MAG TPA: pilus assembly protein [Eubacterium sp.]|nr:pilus assembly protein [Eubacterium sp.]HBZ52651.1 pilus assembly protein [Eubacterium sp.]